MPRRVQLLRSLQYAQLAPGVGQNPSSHTAVLTQYLLSTHAAILPRGASVVLFVSISLDMVDLSRPSKDAILAMEIPLPRDSSIVRLSARPSCVSLCMVPPFGASVFFGEIDDSGERGMLSSAGRLPNSTRFIVVTLEGMAWGSRVARDVSFRLIYPQNR